MASSSSLPGRRWTEIYRLLYPAMEWFRPSICPQKPIQSDKFIKIPTLLAFTMHHDKPMIALTLYRTACVKPSPHPISHQRTMAMSTAGSQVSVTLPLFTASPRCPRINRPSAPPCRFSSPSLPFHNPSFRIIPHVPKQSRPYVCPHEVPPRMWMRRRRQAVLPQLPTRDKVCSD